MLNKDFFQKYQLDVEMKNWAEMQTMKKGDNVQSKDEATGMNIKRGSEIPTMMQGNSIHSKDGVAGTLGGFVTKTNNDQKVYALTCSHLFPVKNIPAFTRDFGEIGSCIFTTRDKGCDFAAIEINESSLRFCDVAFRREDKKKINANVFSDNLQTGNIVHKIGTTTDVTNGIIVSPEFYFKVTDESTRENVFLVKGTAKKFSERGDSGSLVFCRPNGIKQNYVDVVGMVYANDLTLYDDDDDADNDDRADQRKMKSKLPEGSWEEGTYNNEVKAKNEPSSSECDYPYKDNNTASGISQDTNGVSFCCRIHTALKLFEENQGDDFELKFKNDLSSSSPVSSSSSESED